MLVEDYHACHWWQIQAFWDTGQSKSLMEFGIEFKPNTSELPHSIGRLTNLTHLCLVDCKNLHELPYSIGELVSLVELDLKSSGITVLPNSIGNLKRLTALRVSQTDIHTIPCAHGHPETLEVLHASFCPHLMDVPWDMWSLTHLRILELDSSPISTVPTKISGFSCLRSLTISSHQLCPLPELSSSLDFLVVEAAQFPILPDLSSLVCLEALQVCRIHPTITFWTADEVISPWKDPQSIDRLPRSLSRLRLRWIPQ